MTMYPPLPEDARLRELQRQLAPPVAAVQAAPRHLSVWLRAGLIVVGVLLLLVGVAGLFLPGLQGIITILAGIALLSLVSERMDRFLRWVLSPWPRLLERVERLRDRSQDWIHERADAARAAWARRRAG